MIVAETISNLQVSLYLINQLVDIALWAWILMIMIKRVVCRGFDLRPKIILNSIKTLSFISLTKKKFSDLIHNHHYYSDILLLGAALIAVCQFSNQMYSYLIGSKYIITLTTRPFIWIIFNKVITLSVLIKYKKSQPKLFRNIKHELKRILWLEKTTQ